MAIMLFSIAVNACNPELPSTLDVQVGTSVSKKMLNPYSTRCQSFSTCQKLTPGIERVKSFFIFIFNKYISMVNFS